MYNSELLAESPPPESLQNQKLVPYYYSLLFLPFILFHYFDVFVDIVEAKQKNLEIAISLIL